MCRIMFWSPCHGLGQTSNIHMIAIIFNILYKKRILLMQTHFKNNNLEAPLVGYNTGNTFMKEDIFRGIGLDMAVTYSNMKSLNFKSLASCCLTPAASLLLLPGTLMKNRESYERDIAGSAEFLVRDADALVDCVLIDANSGNDRVSIRLMDSADLIVVNLSQRRCVLEEFFNGYEYKMLHKRKIFYLFGDYDGQSSYNIENCRRKYGRYIHRNNSGIIPYSTRYMDAQNESNVISFIRQGLTNGEKGRVKSLMGLFEEAIARYHFDKDETEDFFRYSCLSADKMLQLLSKPAGKGDRRKDSL